MRMHRIRLRRKNMTLSVHLQDDQIATSTKFLDIMHDSYGFSGDLIGTSN